jgi:hypothetical protein
VIVGRTGNRLAGWRSSPASRSHPGCAGTGMYANDPRRPAVLTSPNRLNVRNGSAAGPAPSRPRRAVRPVHVPHQDAADLRIVRLAAGVPGLGLDLGQRGPEPFALRPAAPRARRDGSEDRRLAADGGRGSETGWRGARHAGNACGTTSPGAGAYMLAPELEDSRSSLGRHWPRSPGGYEVAGGARAPHQGGRALSLVWRPPDVGWH